MNNEKTSLEEVLQNFGFDEQEIEFSQMVFMILQKSGENFDFKRIAEMVNVIHFWFLFSLSEHGIIGLTNEEEESDGCDVLSYSARFAQSVMSYVEDRKKATK